MTPATIGRRVGAYAIDLATFAGLGTVLLVVLSLAVFGSSSSGSATAVALTALLGYAVVFAAMLAWWLVYSAMQGGRGSLGQRAVGLAVTDADTGAPIGFWRAVLRNVIWGAGCAVLVGYFTPLFDAGPRRQGWHDRVARDVVVTTASTRRDAQVPLAANASIVPPRPGIPVAPAAFGVPSPPAQRVAPTAPVSVAPANEPTGFTMPTKSTGFTIPPFARPASGSGMIAEIPWRTADALPASVPASAPAPVAPDLASSPDVGVRTAPGARTVAAAAVDAAETDAAADDIAETRAAASVPPPAQRAALYDDAPVLAVLTWDDGSRMAVYGRTLYGRNPACEDGAVVVAVRDETLSLSKTHFEIGGDRAGAWVSDRHSTNGTVLVRDGGRLPLVAGLRTSLRPGDRLEFGDRSARVSDG